jgi:hypothetical protein
MTVKKIENDEESPKPPRSNDQVAVENKKIIQF